jgi:hypothetical protein
MHAPKAPTITPPAPAPPPPSIDVAMKTQQDAATLRQRRGQAASVLAGQDPAAPTTMGAARLLGG